MLNSWNAAIIGEELEALKGIVGDQAAEISALQSYTATETATGETFLGSPVYRKVFTITAFPNNTTTLFDHGVTNLGTVLDLYGTAVDGDGNGITVEYRNTLYLRYTPTQIGMASTSDYSGYSGYIIMEYTKTPPTP